jgi:hypothetical protein
MAKTNKIRKKDGSLTYPYQAVMPFAQVQTLMDELKALPEMEYLYRDNKSYGAKLWGSSRKDVSYDRILATFRKYIPDFTLNRGYASEREYHGKSLHVEIYIAHSEFDRVV